MKKNENVEILWKTVVVKGKEEMKRRRENKIEKRGDEQAKIDECEQRDDEYDDERGN